MVCSTGIVYHVNLFLFFVFTEKIEGSRRGSRRGSRKVSRRREGGGAQVLSTPMGVAITWNGPVPSQSIKLQDDTKMRLVH